MLLELNIINFALIEKLNIYFGRGLNILTGETGAGKSILIDAINYVLGSKFNKELIRTGEEKTYVEAVFTVENSKTKESLDKLGIECEDILIISRVTFQSGKSIAKINGKSVLISHIKEIGVTLLDIHGQHENQNLLDFSTHMMYLDAFGDDNLSIPLNQYRKSYEELQHIKSKILELQGKDNEREKLIDYLKYQIEEIDKYKLKIGEDEELEKKFSIITNAEKINNVLGNCYKTLYNNSEGSTSIYDNLGILLKELTSIEDDIDNVKKIRMVIEESYYNIENVVEDIRDLKENTNYDTYELEYINERLFQINSCKKKYGKSIKEIFEYKDKIQLQYEEFLNSNEVIEKLKLKMVQVEKRMKIKCMEIHKVRENIAINLETKIVNEFKLLGLEKAVFKIDIVLCDEFTQNGLDKTQFLISTNPGEPLKPLDKIVSGGELSRIMLALKTVFADKDKIPSIIFDEIDTGISGRIAQSVGEKMYLISKNHQVFCITHLHQIACMSDEHYIVCKEVINNKTFTQVKKVNRKDKELEIARMLGGSEVTKIALENARELIDMAEIKKMELIRNKAD